MKTKKNTLRTIKLILKDLLFLWKKVIKKSKTNEVNFKMKRI